MRKILIPLLLAVLIAVGLMGAALTKPPSKKLHPPHRVTLATPTPTYTPGYCNSDVFGTGRGGGWIVEVVGETLNTGPTLTLKLWFENVSGHTQTLTTDTQVKLMEGFTTTAFPQTSNAPIQLGSGFSKCLNVTFSLPADGGGGTVKCPFLNGDLLFYAVPGQPASFGMWPSWPCFP